MEEIKVNEYVRLKSGLIGKFYNIEEGYDGNIQINFEEFGYEYEDIEQFYNDIKLHSKILSEVVEVGDFVNGKLIHKIDKRPNYCYLYYENSKTFVDYQIKTILTKEQMKANCYKVGGEDEF